MRLLINCFIATCILFFFNALGWLSISHDGHKIDITHLTWPAFGKVVLIAVIVGLLNLAIGVLLALLLPDACVLIGVILLVFPFIGWATLMLIACIPGMLTLNGFWVTLLCGTVLLIAKVPRE